MVVARTLKVGYEAYDTEEGLPISGAARVKNLLQGDELTMLRIGYENGSSSPVHSHKYETLCFVIKGQAEITIGGETFTVSEGDAFKHPSGVDHSIKAVFETAILEVKSKA